MYGKGGEVISSLQKVLSEVSKPLPGVDVEKSHHGYQQAARRLGAQGDEMAFRVAALCKTEGIPPELVCNSDQTAVHLRPAIEQTYEVKGVKEVKCLGKDDKRQITVVVSSTASGELVPLQLVFQGKTKAVVPKDEDVKRAVAMGSHLTMLENHWSNFVTMKSFVEKVLDPWRVKKCKELGLAPDSQKMV